MQYLVSAETLNGGKLERTFVDFREAISYYNSLFWSETEFKNLNLQEKSNA